MHVEGNNTDFMPETNHRKLYELEMRASFCLNPLVNSIRYSQSGLDA
jgi:hypothetical protein